MKCNLVALTGWIFTRSKHQVCRLENSQKIKSKKEKVHFSLMSKLKKEFIFGYLNGADHRLADQNWPSGIGKLRNLLPESFQILLLSSQQFPHCFLRRWKDRVNRILIKAGKCSARVLALVVTKLHTVCRNIHELSKDASLSLTLMKAFISQAKVF